jgi:hypothetical protein
MPVQKYHAGLALLAALFVAGPVRGASEDADLRATVEAQGAVIAELRAELERVRAEQQESEDRVRALEDQATAAVGAGPAGSDEVTRDWVDRRIEAFETSDDSRFLLSGYGQAQFRNELGSNSQPSTFDLQFNPIFQYRLTDRLHFNAELEFELDDGETELELEFATIDYFLTDWATFTAGKILLPFNVFGPKLHPSWINKLASRPVIYDPNDGVIPVISDVGVMLSGGTSLWSEDSKWNYAVYVANGPTVEVEDGFPQIEFENTPDIHNKKAAGGRIGFLPMPNLELGVSGMAGRSEGEDFNLIGADLWYYLKGAELRGEYVRFHTNPTRWGYYLQGAYELWQLFPETSGWQGVARKLEPVIRWGQTLGDGPDRNQLAVGLDYWLFPSVPLKFTYEVNTKGVDEDRYFLQMAYGF